MTSDENPLRLVFISPFLFSQARGIERFTINLANQLVHLGQEVTLLTFGARTRNTASAIHPDVRVIAVPPSRYYQSVWAVPFYARALTARQHDIVNVFFAGYGEAEAIRLALRRRRFAVNFIVGYPYEQVPHRFEEFRRLKLATRLDRVIVKSRFMAPPLQEFFGRAVEIIPNGIDLDYFNPIAVSDDIARCELDVQSNEEVLVTVAALETRKGMLQVIDTLPSLLEQGLRVRYVIVGEGPDRAVIARHAAARGVHDRVHLVGKKMDVRPYLKIADVFLLPSYGEGFPNALLEALAMEKPVIVSEHPPYDEIVQPEFGVMVNEQATAELTDVIATLLTRPEQRAQMGRVGRTHVQAKYEWSVVARMYLELFRAQVWERAKFPAGAET